MGVILDLEGQRTHQICSFLVGKQLLDQIPFKESPRENDQGSESRSRKVGFGIEAGKFMVNKHQCLRRKDRPFH